MQNTDTLIPKTKTDKAALLISLLLSPFCLIPFFIYLVISKYTDSMRDFWTYIGIAFVFSTVVPFLNVFIMVKMGKISDVHVAKREERTEPFVVGILSLIVGTLLLRYIGAPNQVEIIGWVMIVNGILFFIITFFWKISMHASIFAGMIISLAILVNPLFLLGFLLLPVLIWARIKRHRHNIYQGITATILAAGLTYFLFKMFGY